MKPFYAPRPASSNSSTGAASTETGSDDSENIVYSNQKVTKEVGQEKARTTPKNRASENTESESDTESSSDESGDSLHSQKVLSSQKEEKKANLESLTKSEKLSNQDRATIKSVDALEGQVKPSKSSLQQKRPSKQHEVPDVEGKKGDPPLTSQKKGSQTKASPRKRKRQEEPYSLPGKSLNHAALEGKARKAAQTWTPKDELLLASQLVFDMRSGKSFPVKKGENYWDDLRGRLVGRWETSWSKDQIYDKYRRMKSRYNVLKERMNSDNPKIQKFKSAEEEKLFKICQQLWDKESEEPQPMSKQRQKSSSPSLEEDDESADDDDHVAEEPKTQTTNEGNHADDAEETSGEENKLVAEQSVPNRPRKVVKQRKVSPCPEAPQNGLQPGQADTSDLDHQNLPDKSCLPSDVITYKESAETVSFKLLEKSLNELLETYKQDQSKLLALIEKLVKDFDDKFRWLSQWVMTSMQGGTGASLPRSSSGFPGFLRQDDNGLGSSFQHAWVEQQIQEIQLNIQRMQLIQEILRAQQEQTNGNAQ